MSNIFSQEQLNQTPEAYKYKGTVIEVFSNGILLVFDKSNGYSKAAPVEVIARILNALKINGHVINGVHQIPCFEGELVTIIDYDPASNP